MSNIIVLGKDSSSRCKYTVTTLLCILILRSLILVLVRTRGKGTSYKPYIIRPVDLRCEAKFFPHMAATLTC